MTRRSWLGARARAFDMLAVSSGLSSKMCERLNDDCQLIFSILTCSATLGWWLRWAEAGD